MTWPQPMQLGIAFLRAVLDFVHQHHTADTYRVTIATLKVRVSSPGPDPPVD